MKLSSTLSSKRHHFCEGAAPHLFVIKEDGQSRSPHALRTRAVGARGSTESDALDCAHPNHPRPQSKYSLPHPNPLPEGEGAP